MVYEKILSAAKHNIYFVLCLGSFKALLQLMLNGGEHWKNCCQENLLVLL